MIKIKRSEVERHRSDWKRTARKYGWLDNFRKRNYAIQLFIDVRAGVIADSIYLMPQNKSGKDLFTNRYATRTLKRGRDFRLV